MDVQGSFKPGLVVLFIIDGLLYSAVINILLYNIIIFRDIVVVYYNKVNLGKVCFINAINSEYS